MIAWSCRFAFSLSGVAQMSSRLGSGATGSDASNEDDDGDGEQAGEKERKADLPASYPVNYPLGVYGRPYAFNDMGCERIEQSDEMRLHRFLHDGR